MLIVKTNPSGIDYYIQQLQTELHTKLLSAWNVNTNLYKSYGRCYRNRDLTNGYVAEVFTSDNDYKEVYWDDNLAAISFFGLSGSIKKGLQSEADIHLVFFVDLNKLALKDFDGGAIAHRADNEARASVENVIGKYSNGFQLVSMELGLENVLREYPGSRRDDSSLKIKADMHPVHCFRFNLKLTYNTNKHC